MMHAAKAWIETTSTTTVGGCRVASDVAVSLGGRGATTRSIVVVIATVLLSVPL